MNIHNVRARGKPDKTGDIDSVATSNRLPEIAARIRSEHQATSAALSSAVIHAMAAGDLLIEAKAAIPHGQWLPWLADNCAHLSARTVQLYCKLAKHRATIEKHISNPQCGVADLTLNEAAALCVLAGRIDKLMEFAKRAEVTGGDDLVSLCTSYGFGVSADEGYSPFAGRSEIERRDWCLFGWFIGYGHPDAFTHIEWLLQRPFQNVEEWLGPEGDKFRANPFSTMPPIPDKCREAWKKFHAAHSHMTEADIIAELRRIQAGHDAHQKEDA